MEFVIAFKGRKVGAIGITYPIIAVVQAQTLAEAEVRLYEKWDHCRIVFRCKSEDYSPGFLVKVYFQNAEIHYL